QLNVTRNPVKVMLALINPHQHAYIELPHLNEYRMNYYPQVLEGQEDNADNKWIALESHNTAESMSTENYISALLIKNNNVRKIHDEMAIQQVTLQGRYADLIKGMGWSFVPYASMQEQIKTFQHYQYMLEQLYPSF